MTQAAGILFRCFLFIALFFLQSNSASSALAVSNLDEFDGSGDLIFSDSWRAASFRTDGMDYRLGSATLLLDNVDGIPDNEIFVRIYSDDGGKPGAPVPNGTFSIWRRWRRLDGIFPCSDPARDGHGLARVS